MTAASPAETLRSAAALIRERATKATPGRWHVVFIDGVIPVVDGLASDGHMVAEMQMCGDPVHEGRARADAEHAASWHPLAAVAVADWLDEEAGRAEGADGIEVTDLYPRWLGTFRHPLAVARAYLGDEEAA